MTDRELLELAAKAAGYEVGIYDESRQGMAGMFWCRDGSTVHLTWNPLTDDGDALRLAAALCMSIDTGPCMAKATSIILALDGIFVNEDTIEQDKMTAIRRAIVRAAAEIGRTL